MTLYYVDAAVGSDSNAGTSEGAGNAWLTISKADSVIAAGDTVYIKGSADYGEVVTITTQGTLAAPITHEGYTTTPGDGGKCTNDGTSTLANAYAPPTGNNHLIVKNMIIKNFTSGGISTATGDQIMAVNCHISNSGSYGIRGDNYVFAIGCKMSNVLYGFMADAASECMACEVFNFSTRGIEMDQGIVWGNTIHTMTTGDTAINWISTGTLFVGNNTIDGENLTTTVGVSFTSNFSHITCINNIFYDLATGISVGATNGFNLVGYNLLNSNTANYSNVTPHLGGDVTTAPSFADEAGDDYTLDGDSPALDAGIDVAFTDI